MAEDERLIWFMAAGLVLMLLVTGVYLAHRARPLLFVERWEAVHQVHSGRGLFIVRWVN